MVTGKFYVASVEDRGETEQHDYSVNPEKGGGSGKMPNVAVRLQAVGPEYNPETKQYEGFEDAAFYRSTPQGSIEMVIQNPDAAEQFQTGDKFYVRFERIKQS